MDRLICVAAPIRAPAEPKNVLLSASAPLNHGRPGRDQPVKQDTRFCRSFDGVRLAYAVSGDGPPLVMSATWLTHLEHQ